MARKNDILYNILDRYTGEQVTYSKVTTFTDGTAMSDAKCDGVIYRKAGAEYFKRNGVKEIDPKLFGAKGDGVTNDTVAVQKALSLAGKKTVLIPEGDYYVDNTLTIPSDTTLVFRGRILEKVVGKPLFLADGATNIQFIEAKIAGDGSGTAHVIGQETIKFNNCTNVHVTGGRITGIKGRTGVLFYGCTDFSATLLTIENYSYAGIMCLYGCKRYKINYNTVLNCTNTTAPNTYPIGLSGYDGTVYPLAEDFECEHNYVDNSNNPWWEGIDAHGGKNMRIRNNIVKGCYTGIALVSDGANYTISDATIEGNTLIGPLTGPAREASNVGISIDGVYGATKNIKILNNTIRDFGHITSTALDRGGMKFQNVTGFTISGNVLENNYKHGMRFVNKIAEGRVELNEIKDTVGDTSFAITFVSGGQQINVFVETNTISGSATTYGIYGPPSVLVGADNYLVARNNKVTAATSYAQLPFMLYLNDTLSPQKRNTKNGKVGDVSWSSSPDTTGCAGWVCTVAGNGTTAGTWVPFGSTGIVASTGEIVKFDAPRSYGETTPVTTVSVSLTDAVRGVTSQIFATGFSTRPTALNQSFIKIVSEPATYDNTKTLLIRLTHLSSSLVITTIQQY